MFLKILIYAYMTLSITNCCVFFTLPNSPSVIIPSNKVKDDGHHSEYKNISASIELCGTFLISEIEKAVKLFKSYKMNFKQNFESIDFSKIPFDKINLLSNTVHNLRLYSEYLYFKSEDLIDIHNKINKYNKINKIVRPIQFYRSSSYTITYTNLGSTVVHFSNLARSNKINAEKLKIQVQKKIEYIDNTIKVIIMKLEALKLSIPKEHTANLNSILRSVRQFNKIRSVIIFVNAACSNINKVENLI